MKSSTIEPSSAQATAGPVESIVAERNPTAKNVDSASDAPPERGDKLVEHFNRELAQRRVDLGNSGRPDLDAADLPEPVDGVGEGLRRVALRDAEVAFGRCVI
jgi:hypothetical protein